MFDLGVLISIIVSVLAVYLTIFLQYRNCDNRKKIRIATVAMICILIIVIILYFLPNLFHTYSFTKLTLHDLLKIFPFKEGFFEDYCFRFSYAWGTFLSILILLVVTCCAFSNSKSKKKDLISLFLLFFSCIGITWYNFYISSFLVYCIIHCFEFFAIIFNILTNIILYIILALVFDLFDIKVN